MAMHEEKMAKMNPFERNIYKKKIAKDYEEKKTTAMKVLKRQANVAKNKLTKFDQRIQMEKFERERL